MSSARFADGFGLLIVGSEILDGRVADRHFDTTRRQLAERRLALRYALVLADEPAMIEPQLRWAMERPEPFFCCGGIGATPDDHTRQCAAAAAGVPLEMHPEGAEILYARFGRDANPGRMRMVEFPKGSDLIPNPVNRVPGFRIRNGHFLPGFPEMARPMSAWVLDNWFAPGGERAARCLLLPGAKEGDLVELMERFVAGHPNVSFSSLPRFVPGGTEVRLGVSGPPDAVARGMEMLELELTARGVGFVEVDRSAASGGNE